MAVNKSNNRRYQKMLIFSICSYFQEWYVYISIIHKIKLHIKNWTVRYNDCILYKPAFLIQLPGNTSMYVWTKFDIIR